MLAAGAKMLLAARFPGNPAFQDLPSAGGSVVLVGLVALLAVVGWRSRSRFGDYIRAQMVGFLAFTAILGVMIPNIDNFGHAGGAVIGALVGFAHRPMLRRLRGRKEPLDGPGGRDADRRSGRRAIPLRASCPNRRSSRARRSGSNDQPQAASRPALTFRCSTSKSPFRGRTSSPRFDLATPYNHLTGQPRGLSNPAIANLIRSRLNISTHFKAASTEGELNPPIRT